MVTLPETNIAPKNGWLEYYFPIGEAYFQGQAVSFREGNPLTTKGFLFSRGDGIQRPPSHRRCMAVAAIAKVQLGGCGLPRLERKVSFKVSQVPNAKQDCYEM